MIKIFYFFFIFLFVSNLEAQNFSNAFSFTLPPFDTTTQKFLPKFEKKIITDFIQTSSDGNFTSNGEIIKFFGVNLTTGACFPDKSKAGGIAGRMRKMGINLVRFHHMDNPWTSSSGSIFYQNGSTTSLNTSTLDRLFYFLTKMKNEGVYANINLHVSRTFTEQDGVLYADSIPEFGKGVTFFDSHLINLQKQFAKQLLNTVNPYTGITLSDDPVVAMLEITNENTLYGFWKDNSLQPLSKGGMLLSRHSDTLDLKWNKFLIDKYYTNENLITAWENANNTTPPELIEDGGFESNSINTNWTLEQHETAKAEISVSSTNPYEGNYCAKADVTQITNTGWHIQFEQNNISIEKDSVYTVQFYAKSDVPSSISVSIIKNEDPWTWYGGSSFLINSQWQKYSFSFKSIESNNKLTRLSFILGDQIGTYWFDNVSMSLSVKDGLDKEEDLNLKNIRRIRYSERLGYNDQRVADLAEFYLKLQKDYYDEMYSYLKNDLGVKVPITGSNALGGIYEPFTHNSLDYIDDHAYWDHPSFPNQPWSGWDWNISNNSMLTTDYLGVIPDIFGGLQVNNKPYTISEYNHPQPNIYQVEMLPILAGYGSFNGADGLMFFEYNGGDPADWQTDIQNNFFGLHRNTPIMALFPLFAYAFQNGLIQEDPSPILVEYSEDYILNMSQHDDHHRWHKYYPYDNNISLTKSVRIEGFSFPKEDIPTQTINQSVYRTSTNEIIFSTNHNLLAIQTPKFESITGQLENAELFAGNHMQVKKGETHCTIAWLSLTDNPLNTSKKSILAISSRIQNQNMTWDGNSTVHNNWGNPPTEVQAMNLELLLNIEADSILIYPLDEIGNQMEGFTVMPYFDNHFWVQFNQNELKSLWFGIEAFNNTSQANDISSRPNIKIFPNPTDSKIFIQSEEEIISIKIYDIQGSLINSIGGKGYSSIDISEFQNGQYLLKITTDKGISTFSFVKSK